MMWESKQPDSKWREYFDIMPTRFDSLMFWTDKELIELKGSTIVGTGRSCYAVLVSLGLIPLIQIRLAKSKLWQTTTIS